MSDPGGREVRFRQMGPQAGDHRSLVRRTAHADSRRAGPVRGVGGHRPGTLPGRAAAAKRRRRNPGITEIIEIEDRGHALTIDHGWQEVADTALTFVRRFL
ncbi:hypothetical protein ACFW2V_15065 [Streptomyces sp. NPDC058947]|uniref:hypothetical protein n=1 Tax=Streptomyces TaxID=1883 RepID=UPI0036CF75DD